MTPERICDTLGMLQGDRNATKKAMGRLDNQCRAMARRALGWSPDLPEKERGKVNRKAEAVVKAVRKEKDPPEGCEEIAVMIAPFVSAAESAREPLGDFRQDVEKRMCALAESLPVWEWADKQRGFGSMGLAIIVGEAGSLANYSNPAKLWKRFGLGLVGDKRQGSPGTNATAEDWIEHGYSKSRRSAMWTIGDALVKQGNGYRELYLARKEFECDKVGDDHPTICRRGEDPDTGRMRYSMHCNRRAQRYMEKRLLRDLWRAWNQTEAAS